MGDIYHQLIKSSPEFENHTDESLAESVDLYAAGASAITSALTLIGNLALNAVYSEDYSDEEARRDLILISYALLQLPRIEQAFNQNSATADYVRVQRRKAEAKK